jgi:anti-sigma B factor antagonist
LDIQTKTQGQVAVVAISGSIDALTSSEVSSHLTSQVGQGYRHIVLDLSQVEYMSSAGLRAIMEGLKSSRQAGGDLRLASPQPGVDKVLKMAGFPSILKSFASPVEAAASFEN